MDGVVFLILVSSLFLIFPCCELIHASYCCIVELLQLANLINPYLAKRKHNIT